MNNDILKNNECLGDLTTCFKDGNTLASMWRVNDKFKPFERAFIKGVELVYLDKQKYSVTAGQIQIKDYSFPVPSNLEFDLSKQINPVPTSSFVYVYGFKTPSDEFRMIVSTNEPLYDNKLYYCVHPTYVDFRFIGILYLDNQGNILPFKMIDNKVYFSLNTTELSSEINKPANDSLNTIDYKLPKEILGIDLNIITFLNSNGSSHYVELKIFDNSQEFLYADIYSGTYYDRQTQNIFIPLFKADTGFTVKVNYNCSNALNCNIKLSAITIKR